MKRTIKIILILCILFIFQGAEYALKLLDHFETNQSIPGIVEYSSMLKPTAPNTFPWRNPPDDTMLSLPLGEAEGSVVYAIRGVSGLQVSIYNNSSTYAVASKQDSTKYVMGHQNEGADVGSLQNKFDVKYSAADKTLYSKINGQWHQYQGTAFVPAEQAPSNLTSYGLRVHCSKDNANWAEVSGFIRMVQNDQSFTTASWPKQSYYYENFHVNIPADTKYIKITISGFGTPIPKNTFRLAQAQVEGKDIQIGEEEVVPIPPPSSSSDLIPPPSSSSTSSTPPPPSSSGGTGGTTKPSSSSKPVTGSSKSSSSKSSSSKSSSSKSSSSKSSSSKSSSSKTSSSKASTSSSKAKESTSSDKIDDKQVKGDADKSVNGSSKVIQMGGENTKVKDKSGMNTGVVAVIYGITVLAGVLTFVLKGK